MMWLRLNRRLARLVLALAITVLTATSHAALTQDQTLLRGVVVEEVGAGSAGEKAGIRPDDVLLSWVRAAAPPANPEEAHGEIGSPFDLTEVEVEQAPRGEVRLLGSRGGASFSVVVPPGAWVITVRPNLADPLLSGYQQGKKLIAAKDMDTGIALWRDVAAQAIATNRRDSAWVYLKAGDALAGVSKWDEAHAEYQASIEALNGLEEHLSLARIWEARGRGFERQSDLRGADTAYREALRLRERLSAETLAVAATLTSVGSAALARGDLADAEASFSRALSIREKLAPASLVVAAALNNLAIATRNRGDVAAAEQLHKRSLAIREKLAPDGIPTALSLTNSGAVAADRGNLVGAEDFYKRSLAILEKLDPGGNVHAATLNNLGIVSLQRGDFAAAADLFRRALANHEKRAPASLDVAGSLTNLGLAAREGGDLGAAEEMLRRSLAIAEPIAPSSLEVASTLHNLGGVVRDRGDRAAAEQLFARSLGIHERLGTGSLFVAANLNSLGDLAAASGDLAGAEGLHRRALAIQQRLAPNSASEAESLNSLGVIARDTGRRDVAVEHFQHASAALEGQTGRLGGAEDVRTGFTAKYVEIYRNHVELLVDLKRLADAFHVVERSRARSFLATLAERDLVFADDLPVDLARKRTLVNADYDRTQAAIARLNPAKDADEIDGQLARLRELRDEREQIAQAIRKTSPRYASLVYPQPLDLAGAQRSLDPGTVLLAYSVDKQKTFLFVVQPARPLVRPAPPLSVFTLPIGEAALREKVSVLRNLVQRGAQAGASAHALVTAGQELFAALIEPARALIAASDRVLLSSDGPLHTLPFAALVQPSTRGPARYFVEWKPLHVVASATVYAELKKTRRSATPPASVTLAAFGDPVYPRLTAAQVEGVANPEVRAAVRRGYTLEPLPGSRREVEGIVRLYPGRAATFLGEQATEERAKAAGRDVRYLHFASHGLLDERFPLNSALALTIPKRPAEGQANGLLQAWEIFEQVRIDADLVTLSACETGLGKELGGEGLMGLTRAFQYAGARTVLASLWSVGDDSTADLMPRFYGHLKAGRAKDEALRAAQLEMIRARGSSHPFQWAAFQLSGDWK